MASFVPYLIVCPLVFIAGFVDAVAGGGGLISLPAYLISGIPVHMAIGTNKLSSGMGTALATFRYAKSGYIRWKLAAFCAVCALAGSSCGAELALLIDDGAFKIIMLVILPLVALYVLRGKALVNDGEKTPLSPVKTTVIAMVVALVIGAYDGFYGPGTGTFLILLLTGVAHLQLSEANGIAKVTNLSTNVAALTVYLFNGKVIFPLGLAAGCFSIAGNYIGTRFFAKGGAKSVKPIILIVLAIFFVKVLTEVLG
ncbi:MAG: sulfite exporter TauE/SafE family protein [Christensenellales bacterium]